VWTDYDSVNKTLKAKFANASFKPTVLEGDVPLLNLCAETLAAADELKELDYNWLGENPYEGPMTVEMAACMGKSLPRLNLKNFRFRLDKNKRTQERHGGMPGTTAQLFEVRAARPSVRGASIRARRLHPASRFSPLCSRGAGLLRRGRPRGVRRAGDSACWW